MEAGNQADVRIGLSAPCDLPLKTSNAKLARKAQLEEKMCLRSDAAVEDLHFAQKLEIDIQHDQET